MATTNDAKYIYRGELLCLKSDASWDDDLVDRNEGKVGAPYLYPEPLFVYLAVHRALAGGTPFRQLEGMARRMLGCGPDHSTIRRRILALDVEDMAVGDCSVDVTPTGERHTVRMAIDGSGLKHNNRGEWIHHKWNTRRGFIKMHVLIDMDTMKVLTFVLTDETGSDVSQFIPLVEKAIRAMGGAGAKDGAGPDEAGGPATAVYADGAYGSRPVIKFCKENGITSRIKLKITSGTRGKGTGDAFGEAVRDQLGGSPESSVHQLSKEERQANQKKWKKRVGYGRRWLVEIFFSAFKRIFGECVRSNTWSAILQEIRIRVAIYNHFQDVA